MFRVEDLFVTPDNADPFAAPVLRVDLIEHAITEPIPSISNVDFADTLVVLIREDLERHGCGGHPRTSDEEFRLLIRAAIAASRRIGVSLPTLPFRDFTGFRAYWKREGMDGSYQSRRDYLAQVFEPIQAEIFRKMDVTWDASLLDPVSPRGATGWLAVDQEIDEMRSRFAHARTAQDYGAVGLASIRILENLGELVYDDAIHGDPERTAPARDKTKTRFELVIDYAVPGSENEVIRRFSKATVELAHLVKHRTTPTRKDAGVAADGVIALANVLRRLTTGSESG